MAIQTRSSCWQAIVAFIGLVSLVLIADSGFVAANDDSASDRTTQNGSVEKPTSSDEHIRGLIEKLGSDSYATRIRARNQLKMYGLEAFDALREAQNHDDSEILSAASYLISSLQVSWSKDSDPKEVREILLEYGAQRETERLGRIEMLGRLRDQMGIEPLARLARFDHSVPLSRRAAMLVLQQPLNREKASRLRLADRIEAVIGENQRDSSKWLLAYASDLREGDYSEERWKSLVADQRKIVDSGAEPDVTSASVMQLIRVLASRASSEDGQRPALSLVMDHIDLVAPTTVDLTEHASWSIRQGLFPVVIALYKQHQHTFGENAELLYSAAQAYEEIGDIELAEELADEAFQINPLPKIVASKKSEDGEKEKEAPKNAITDHQLQEIAYAHHQVAALLRMRGRFKWSERENREVIRHCNIESIVGVSARQELARMFSEQLRHEEAAVVLFPIADRAKKDGVYQTKMSGWRISLKRIRSLYQLESGLSQLEKGPLDSDTLKIVTSKLQLAYRFDSENIDILIRMYRLDDPNDPDWKSTVAKQIRQNQDKLIQDIARTESRKKMMAPEQYKEALGELYNQYAWLVANTEGDFKRALKCSLDSLDFLDTDDINQRAARLDTCARCYFSLGRVEEAIQAQEQAIKIDPFSPPMLRQLEQFKAAL